ncbi:uncharacterized protein LOC116338170 isoform X1 [Contarinia nasturtii]|uniref:uncharacterized protein LOC116338170 isoform X1 n=1 Tax=Contarinia nasturtii TaxID=265458 RepID=UPI0012D4902D|nr:uncharacterized protein LOC116338170 isoform X1 [Contarinia nasturtii]
MDVNHLGSWKIASAQPFYPIGVGCIEFDDKSGAVATYTAQTINTFIFQNFGDGIENDKPANKSYLHKSFFPERIRDAVITSESVILLENGQIKYFASSKDLVTVEYLSGVQTICSTQHGFALIKISSDGTKFFIEFHPRIFHRHSRPESNEYDISFSKIMELQNTWRQCHFKVKELCIKNYSENQFLKKLISDDIGVNANDDFYIFLSIDNSLCSIHIVDEQSYVNPIVMCTTKIVDFWAAKDGNYIILLLENGTLEAHYLTSIDNSINKKTFYFGNEIQTYHYHGHDGIFMFSNGVNVEYGMIEFNVELDSFKFKRKAFNLPGIVAMTYLPGYKLILCVSENCHFYKIAVRIQEPVRINDEWIELDQNIQSQLSNVKYQLIELTDAYENLVNQQEQQRKVLNVIKFRRNDLDDTENDIGKIGYRFVGACSVTQMPPIQQHHINSKNNLIYVSNSMVYDRITSFFVTIKISTTVKYANEFGEDLWYLSCRWLNDKHENLYASIKLNEGRLADTIPITLIIHLQQTHLPCFTVDISTRVACGRAPANRSLCLNFPVRLDQPDYCEMMHVSSVLSQVNEISDDKSLMCSILAPKTVPLNDIISEMMDLEQRTQAMDLKCGSNQKVYEFYLLGKTLTAIHFPDTETLRLVSIDADFMQSFKQHLHRKIETKLSNLGLEFDVKVSTDALKEYCSADNFLNAILNASDITNKTNEMLHCMRKVRQIKFLSPFS